MVCVDICTAVASVVAPAASVVLVGQLQVLIEMVNSGVWLDPCSVADVELVCLDLLQQLL